MTLERSQHLVEILGKLEPPDAVGARLRGVSQVADAVVERRATRSRAVPAFVSVFAALIVAGIALLTPPGRAVAEWAAELVGIGEVGGAPSVDDPIRNAPPSSERVVFATGTTPVGDRFEIVGYRSDEVGIGTRQSEPATCVQAVFPEAPERFDGGGSGMCYWEGPTEGDVRFLGLGFPGRDGPGSASADGEANARTRKVEVSYMTESGERRTVNAAVAVLDGELGERIGVIHPTVYFYAFLPGFTERVFHSGTAVEAVAYDEAGNEIARDTMVYRDHGPPGQSIRP